MQGQLINTTSELSSADCGTTCRLGTQQNGSVLCRYGLSAARSHKQADREVQEGKAIAVHAILRGVLPEAADHQWAFDPGDDAICWHKSLDFFLSQQSRLVNLEVGPMAQFVLFPGQS